MTWGRGIAIVAATTTAGILVGAGIGYLLGVFVPGYYRTVFSGGSRPGFDPVAVGLGQGATQGTVLGVVVGLLLVAGIAWFKLRSRSLQRRDG